MKVSFEKNIVEFVPESLDEKATIETLWKKIIDCNGEPKKLVPIGEYNPQKNHNAAMFVIEGLELEEQGYTPVNVEDDCVCYCVNCNKQVSLKKGNPIPVCCGKIMEIID